MKTALVGNKSESVSTYLGLCKFLNSLKFNKKIK